MKILAIDSAIETIEYLANNLEPLGYKVQGAIDIGLALNAAQTGFHADIIIINLALCRPQFFSFLQDLRKAHPHVSMVALSESNSDIAPIKALALGFHGLITTPFELEAILQEFQRIAHVHVTNESPLVNTRRESRFQISLPVMLEICDDQRQALLEHTVTIDISCSGACVRTRFDIGIGTSIKLLLTSQQIKFQAIVRGSFIDSNSMRHLNLEIDNQQWCELVKLQAGLTDLIAMPAELAVDDTEPTRTRILDNRYQLLQLIGQGGLGAVYRARDLKTDRIVAVKLLINIGETENERAYSQLLFQRESDMLMKVHHKNIVAILDSGISSNGEPFLVMEFIEGTPLDELIRTQGNWSMARVAQLLEQICPALHEMHSKNVIHRDLKPGNIIIRKETTGEVATLVDLGLAKRVRNNDDEFNINSLTQTGMIVGTLPYISPEQCMGEKIDIRADIYSLGILLYELLTGQVPFEASSVGGWLLAHVKTVPSSLCEINQNITPEVEQVVLWALAKDPNARPQTMLELLAGFTAALTNSTDSQREVTPKKQVIGKAAPTLRFPAEAVNL